jgi:capsular polysaccharide transport system permease protein
MLVKDQVFLQKDLFLSALVVQARVVGALILRDMRTRFGRTFFGYVISVLWPLTHLLVVMSVYLVIRRMMPFGTSPAVFLGTGILPYILCLYPARMITMSLVQNQPLLYFPVVKSFDVILARGILEVVTSFWVIAIFCFILYVFGVEVMPIYPEQALLAIFATIYLGFSIGFLGAVFYKVIKAWIVVVIVTLIIMYVTSGAFLYPAALSPKIQYYMSWNPLFHSVEWLRSAYYDGYGNDILDRGYLIGFASLNLFAGLVAERVIREVVLKN